MAIETDIQLSQRQQKKRKLWIEAGAIMAITVIFAVILPLALPAFRLRLLGRFVSLTIVALGIDLIWGYTGQIGRAHV